MIGILEPSFSDIFLCYLNKGHQRRSLLVLELILINKQVGHQAINDNELGLILFVREQPLNDHALNLPGKGVISASVHIFSKRKLKIIFFGSF